MNKWFVIVFISLLINCKSNRTLVKNNSQPEPAKAVQASNSSEDSVPPSMRRLVQQSGGPVFIPVRKKGIQDTTKYKPDPSTPASQPTLQDNNTLRIR
ncbi:MAG: hypothetical protein IPK03_14640 [Bacteroidetes bacterium]|nr:hypothetical protein [Bacteroidota bacterium]